VGRDGSTGALTVSVSAAVPEKSRGNKKSDEEKEEAERHFFALLHHCYIKPVKSRLFQVRNVCQSINC